MIPSDVIGGSPLQASDLSTSATRDELGSPPPRGALNAAPGSVAAAVTAQGFDKRGVEGDFYSLTSLRGESRFCGPSRHSAARAPAQGRGESPASDAGGCLAKCQELRGSTSRVWLTPSDAATPLLLLRSSNESGSDGCCDALSATLTRSASVGASALPRDRGPSSRVTTTLAQRNGPACATMPLCSVLCAPSSHGALPLAGQGRGEVPAGQGQLGRAGAAGQASLCLSDYCRRRPGQ